jgi:hypothetical protein
MYKPEMYEPRARTDLVLFLFVSSKLIIGQLGLFAYEDIEEGTVLA